MYLSKCIQTLRWIISVNFVQKHTNYLLHSKNISKNMHFLSAFYVTISTLPVIRKSV